MSLFFTFFALFSHFFSLYFRFFFAFFSLFFRFFFAFFLGGYSKNIFVAFFHFFLRFIFAFCSLFFRFFFAFCFALFLLFALFLHFHLLLFCFFFTFFHKKNYLMVGHVWLPSPNINILYTRYVYIYCIYCTFARERVSSRKLASASWSCSCFSKSRARSLENHESRENFTCRGGPPWPPPPRVQLPPGTLPVRAIVLCLGGR